jgi:hypothetical protein
MLAGAACDLQHETGGWQQALQRREDGRAVALCGGAVAAWVHGRWIVRGADCLQARKE